MSTFTIMFDPYNTWGFRKDRTREYQGDDYVVDLSGNIVINRDSIEKAPTTIASGKWLSITEM